MKRGRKVDRLPAIMPSLPSRWDQIVIPDVASRVQLAQAGGNLRQGEGCVVQRKSFSLKSSMKGIRMTTPQLALAYVGSISQGSVMVVRLGRFAYTHPILKMHTTAALILLFILASQRSAMGKSPRVKSQMALVTL
jgi:hypothetical protein